MIEKEKGYRGSKSAPNIAYCTGTAKINNNVLGVVKEQRVNGSYIGPSRNLEGMVGFVDLKCIFIIYYKLNTKLLTFRFVPTEKGLYWLISS